MAGDLPPVGKLKTALIETLIDAVENGVKVVVDGALETVTCPANVLAVAAKVVKDFHEEAGLTRGEAELNDVVQRYQLRKAGEGKAAH